MTSNFHSSSLETFYSNWSSKEASAIAADLVAADRKAAVIMEGLDLKSQHRIKSILDFGCGYGQCLKTISQELGCVEAFGFDFSKDALEVAHSHNSAKGVSYHRKIGRAHL